MPSKREGSKTNNRKRKDRRKASPGANEYLSIAGDRHNLIMTPQGIMMEDGLVTYKNIVRIYKKKDTDFYGYARIRVWFTTGKTTVRKVKSGEASKFILAVRKKMKELGEEKTEDSTENDLID